MSLLEKLDRIPPPWSNLAALAGTTFVAAAVVWISRLDLPSQFPGVVLGVGMIFGGLLTLLLKAGLEASDKEALRWILNIFRGTRRTD